MYLQSLQNYEHFFEMCVKVWKWCAFVQYNELSLIIVAKDLFMVIVRIQNCKRIRHKNLLRYLRKT